MSAITSSTSSNSQSNKNLRKRERNEEGSLQEKRVWLSGSSSASKKVKRQMIKAYQGDLHRDKRNELARNGVSQVGVYQLSLDRTRYKTVPHIYSVVVGGKVRVTNQKSSGRCWIFAGLNAMRIPFKKENKLEYFEFSCCHLYFWDRIEKANLFLNRVIKYRKEGIDSRINQSILGSGIYDGGHWAWFANLVKKYGVMPRNAMPERYNSSYSSRMRSVLNSRMREFALKLRKMTKNGAKKEELRKEKNQMLNEVYRIVSIFLGEPPKKFDWQYVDTGKKVHTIQGLTALKFKEKYVSYDPSKKVVLTHYPHDDVPFGSLFCREESQNMQEKHPISLLNLPVSELKRYVIKSLKERKEGVWFSCDVEKDSEKHSSGVMDPDLINLELIFGFEKKITKKERILACDTYASHAMLITGVDLREDKDGNEVPHKWRVENSWGKSSGVSGFLCMMDRWFDEHVFEVIIDRSLLSSEHLDIFEDDDAIEVSWWHPLGVGNNG